MNFDYNYQFLILIGIGLLIIYLLTKNSSCSSNMKLERLTEDFESNNTESETNNKIQICLYFAEWCGHCKNFKPTWNLLKNKYKRNKNYEFIDYDCTNSNVGDPRDKNMVEGFPTIIIEKNGKRIRYEGDRSMSAIEKILKE